MNEFLGEDPESIPYQVSERAGPVVVWRRALILAIHPWHTHWVIDERGDLHLFDLRRRRWVGHWPAGSWTTVNRLPEHDPEP